MDHKMRYKSGVTNNSAKASNCCTRDPLTSYREQSNEKVKQCAIKNCVHME